MITFSNIVDRFETFVENHFFLKSFSFGSPEDLDLDKFENFPLCHLVYTSGSYADKVKSTSWIAQEVRTHARSLRRTLLLNVRWQPRTS